MNKKYLNDMALSENNFLSYWDLIPHNPLSLLQEPSLRINHLKIFCFLIKNSIFSLIYLFEEKNYNFFDPHVGDTLCQIRATQIVYIAKNKTIDYKKAIYALEIIHEKALNLLPEIENTSKMRRKKADKTFQDHQTLESFFNENLLNISMHESIFFLVKTFLLTKYKIHELEFSPRIDYSQLQKDLGISKDLAYRMIRHWQRGVARSSALFIQKISQQYSSLIPILKKIDDDGREVLPSFFVMIIIVNFLLDNKIPILFIIRHPKDITCPILKVCYRPFKETFMEVNSSNQEEPHFVAHLISNIVASKKKLLSDIIQTSVKNVLLASVSNHPQYSGKKLAMLSLNPYKNRFHPASLQKEALLSLKKLSKEYLIARNFAKKVGCDFENPAFVFVEHMLIGKSEYQDTLHVNKNQLLI